MPLFKNLDLRYDNMYLVMARKRPEDAHHVVCVTDIKSEVVSEIGNRLGKRSD